MQYKESLKPAFTLYYDSRVKVRVRAADSGRQQQTAADSAKQYWTPADSGRQW
jgi:hypothetical protein